MSFKFYSKDWYPKLKSHGLINEGLSGVIDFTTGKGNWTAKYQDMDDAVITTFTVAGTKKK